MNQIFEKIRTFFSNPTKRSAFLLSGCAVLAIAAAVIAALSFSDIHAENSTPTIGSVPDVSFTVQESVSSKVPVSTDSPASVQDSSSAAAEEKEPIVLKIDAHSYTQDLNVNVLDDSGAVVRGTLFYMTVKGLEKHNSDYDKRFALDALDGNLYLSWIPEGKYQIALEDLDGFVTPEPIEINVKEYVVVYEKIEDIADKIVDEDDVNVKEDDNAYGGNGNDNAGTSTPPPTVTDTVPFIESSKKDVVQNVKDSNGNTLYTYTYETGPNGFLLFTDGTESTIKPVETAGNLSHGIKYMGSTANAAAAIDSTPMAAAISESTLFAVQLSVRMDNDNSTPASDTSTIDTPADSISVPDSSDPASSDPGSSTESESQSPAPDNSEQPPSSDDSSSAPEAARFTVNFVNPDGSPLASVSVTAGGTASPPADPVLTGAGYTYVFTGWSASYENVQQDLTITAVYDIYAAEKTVLFNADNTPLSTYRITATARTETVTVYTGWQTINGKTYYYTADNKAVTGWQVIQGISYFFNSSGVRSDCMGIDVSRWNGNINWTEVKKAGIDFAIIRVGYRGYGTGALVEDPLARTNLAGAQAAGIKIGVYVFSQAITLEEAVQEASMALEIVKGYKLDYPIFIDSEYSTSAKDGRADNLSTAQRTAICEAFCKTIANSGYRTGIYASKSWFMYQLNVAALEQYVIWVAHYTTATDYSRRYDMWQYTSTASVPGIKGDVDMNFSYLNY